MSWNSTNPKSYRPISTTGNTWSNDAGRSGQVYPGDPYRDGWIYYNITPMASGVTGKIFTFDFVHKGETVGFFNLVSTGVRISFRFYSMLSGWSSTWHQWDESWQILSASEGVQSMGIKLWDNYATYGTYRPAWGRIATDVNGYSPTITAAGPSYSDFAAGAMATGNPTAKWDESWSNAETSKSYSRYIPYGVRYVSNGINAMPGRRHPNPAGIITRHGQVGANVTWSYLDGGNTSSGMKTITLSPTWIQARHGTLAGVTKFEMKIELLWNYGSGNDVLGHWRFGGDEPQEAPFTTIDNPQIGLLDHTGDTRDILDWPLRFDAQAYYRNGSAAEQKLQAQYKTAGGSWGIF